MRSLAWSWLLLMLAFPVSGRASSCLEDSEVKDWLYGSGEINEGTCSRVSENCTATYLFNPSGSQVIKIRSDCFYRLARRTGDVRYCQNVIQAKAWFLDGSDFTPERCVKQVTAANEQKAKDEKARADDLERQKRLNEAASKKWLDEQNAAAKKIWDERHSPEAKIKKFHEMKAQGIVWWGGADPQCRPCGYNGSDARTSTCDPHVCAPRAYYQCSPQDPPMKFTNDPRVLDLIHSKACSMYMQAVEPGAFTVDDE
jgi:hypothetical protein